MSLKTVIKHHLLFRHSSDLSFQRAVITQTLMLYNYNHHITVRERKNIHPDTMLCIVLINTLPSLPNTHTLTLPNKHALPIKHLVIVALHVSLFLRKIPVYYNFGLIA